MSSELKIAFNTANLVGRVTGYRFELSKWMDQHHRTMAETNEAAWRAICGEIADAGYSAVEVWEAHAAPEVMNEAKAKAWKRIMADAGLTPIGYAGQFREQATRVCQWLGIDRINGGTGNLSPQDMTDLARATGVGFNLENHPQKSTAEILEQIGGGNDVLGVCIDTGWLGTQGVDAPAIIAECGQLVRHVHMKDVVAAGGHETCLLGSGRVDLIGCVRELKRLGYDGWYAWEDEPEDRNPMDTAAANRQWLEAAIAGDAN